MNQDQPLSSFLLSEATCLPLYVWTQRLRGIPKSGRANRRARPTPSNVQGVLVGPLLRRFGLPTASVSPFIERVLTDKDHAGG